MRIKLLMLGLLFAFSSFAGGYQIGDKAKDFKLKNVDGKMVSLADYKDAQGFIIIFTCNHCPFSMAYENRIIELNNKYAPLGYPVIAINPNDPDAVPEDSFDKMVERSKAKKFTFPYLLDEGQKIYPKYGATRTPHVFILQKEGKEGKDLIVRYIGAIDDNSEDPSAVKVKYVEQAVEALLKALPIPLKETRAVGCTIKVKR